jgi:hypothetical protein
MEEYLAELVPVSEWKWWLWRVVWSDDQGNSKVLWCVSTETHIEEEVNRRWPSDSWTWCYWEPVQIATAPRTLWCPATRRNYPEDPWTAGERAAKTVCA